MTLVARVRGGVDPSVVQDRMRAALLDLDPRLPPLGVGSVELLYEFGRLDCGWRLVRIARGSFASSSCARWR